MRVYNVRAQCGVRCRPRLARSGLRGRRCRPSRSPAEGRPAPLKASRRSELRRRQRHLADGRSRAVPIGKQGSLSFSRSLSLLHIGAGRGSVMAGGELSAATRGAGRSGPASRQIRRPGSRRSLVVRKHTLHKLCREEQDKLVSSSVGNAVFQT